MDARPAVESPADRIRAAVVELAHAGVPIADELSSALTAAAAELGGVDHLAPMFGSWTENAVRSLAGAD